MRFFAILLLFCIFSDSYGAAKRAVDTRTDYLLGAIFLTSGTVESVETLNKFFSEVKAGALTESYEAHNLSRPAKSYTLGWGELRKRVAESVRKVKFKKNKGKDLALYLSNQFGLTLWRMRGYSSVDLKKDPDLMDEEGGNYIFPKDLGVMKSEIQCGQLFRGLVEMHWNDPELKRTLLRVISYMDKQRPTGKLSMI